jgi:hypothetical protein
MSIAPRRDCTFCGRSIAVVAGRRARHDPEDRGPILLSCHGSLEPVPLLDLPDRAGTPSLFDLADDDSASDAAGPAQPALWE